jgi:glyoxylase-like metal-dependent hydrolase (beta-lactamase superfamily II)
MAGDWYETHPIDDGITLILETHHDPVWRANTWHVRGRDRDLVVDTGLGLKPLSTELAKLTDRPVLALSTHCHYDHWGGMHEFADRLAHSAEADVYAAPTRHNIVAENFFVGSMLTVDPHPGFEAESWCIDAAPLTRRLDEGDIIDLGDRAFRVLHIPGHSPGSIALWEEDTGILFAGDTLYDGELIDDLFHSVPEQLRDSLERLRALPVRIVHGGHYDSFDAARMKAIIDEYLAGGRRYPTQGV